MGRDRKADHLPFRFVILARVDVDVAMGFSLDLYVLLFLMVDQLIELMGKISGFLFWFSGLLFGRA